MEPPIVKGRVEEPTTVQLDTPKTPDTTSSLPADKQAPSKDELFATYDLDHKAPYLAELFGIESLWAEPDLTYKSEITSINDYLMQEIREKNLDNSVGAVKKRVATMEKQASIDPTTSVELKVKLLAEHARYLAKLNNIKLGVRFDGIAE